MDEMKKMWKETVITCIIVLSQNFPNPTGESYQKLSGQLDSEPTIKYSYPGQRAVNYYTTMFCLYDYEQTYMFAVVISKFNHITILYNVSRIIHW